MNINPFDIEDDELPARTAGNLQPGDIIFGDEMVLGVMEAELTVLGQQVMVLTDKDTFRVLAEERI